MNEHTKVEILARCHDADLRREAERQRRLALLPRRPARARLADLLVALAMRLAPAGQGAPAALPTAAR